MCHCRWIAVSVEPSARTCTAWFPAPSCREGVLPAATCHCSPSRVSKAWRAPSTRSCVGTLAIAVVATKAPWMVAPSPAPVPAGHG